MALHRFFIPPEWISERQVTLMGDVAHQIRRALRLKAGDRIIVLDNTGWEGEVTLSRVGHNVVMGRVVEERQSAGEPRTHISLYQAVTKARRFEWVLQKGTELGIVEFIPMACERSVVGHLEDADRKQERWQHIIREAAEQSWRGRLPVLQPTMLFPQAVQRAVGCGGLQLVPWQAEEMVSLKAALTRDRGRGNPPAVVSLFVGPEGGLTTNEMQAAVQYGAQPVSLGPCILRAETAGLVAASAILYQLEG
jgi:16S rRNA (uracil1498-N3)-methyltransferase